MRIQTLILLAVAQAALSGCTAVRVDKAAQVASGLTSHWLCADTFVSGLDPDRSYAERVRPLPGMDLVAWALRYRVDPQRREVRTTIGGAFESRAVYRDRLGCVVTHGDETVDAPQLLAELSVPALLPDIAGAGVVEPADAGLQAALARAFSEPAGAAARHNARAVVVLRDGKVVAERYASGYGIETPLLGFSMTKSVVHALVGILVREGRLSLEQPAPIDAWRDAADPRHAITIDQLLRQTSGLDLAQTNSGFDPTSHIMFIERDKAAASATASLAAAPGTRWNYTDAHYMLLSRIVRDAVGGQAGDALRFAQQELFGPLGMRHVTLEVDATGTPMGAVFMLASARDWARFGQLYLNDGVAGGRRILPEGWVRHAATPTLDTGYGAGFWTNRVAGDVPRWGVPWGLPHAPRDAFFARGFMGQFVVVMPSERLVVVRLATSHVRGDDIEATDRLVGDVLAALHASPS